MNAEGFRHREVPESRGMLSGAIRGLVSGAVEKIAAPAGAGFGNQHRHYSRADFPYQPGWQALRGASIGFPTALQRLQITSRYAPNIRPSLSTPAAIRPR